MKNYTWDYIQKHPQETKRLLGINYEQLTQLLAQGKLIHPGPISDLNICRQVLNRFLPQQLFIGDQAYVGEQQITTPVKKPKTGELTP